MQCLNGLLQVAVRQDEQAREENLEDQIESQLGEAARGIGVVEDVPGQDIPEV